MAEDRSRGLILDRRTALTSFGALGSLFLLGCKDSSSASSADAAVDPDAPADLDAALDGDGACAVTPEGEIGPYFADDSAAGFARSNVVANVDGTDVQPGIPLVLTLYIYDSEQACTPVAGAQVDIWHCNASGVYSDIAVESTVGQTWLRGYQSSDAGGKVTFTTIVPGWYQGRTTHIHLRVRSSYSEASSTSDGTNTTQVFFAQTLVDMLATTVAPYSAQGKTRRRTPPTTSTAARPTASASSRWPGPRPPATPRRTRSTCRSPTRARAAVAGRAASRPATRAEPSPRHRDLAIVDDVRAAGEDL